MQVVEKLAPPINENVLFLNVQRSLHRVDDFKDRTDDGRNLMMLNNEFLQPLFSKVQP